MQVLHQEEQLAACLRHCRSVAAALTCELPSCLLHATIYHTAAAPAADLVREFGRWHERGPGNDTNCTDEETATAVHDSYLRTRALEVKFSPLMLLVQLPTLPRGSTIEVQPVCAVHPGADAAVASDSSGAIR